jgi:polyphosphate kinase
VRSIVGRFLEHSRVFYFLNEDGSSDDASELYLASADWMERNFFRRVEVAFPVREQTHRARILRDLNFYLADNSQAWTLGRDGDYTHCERGEAPVRDAQATLLGRYAAGSAPASMT